MAARSVLSEVNSARLEGRLETVTQRQKEIQAIHTAVRKNEGKLRNALLAEDSRRTEVDILVEMSAALQLLRLIFHQLSLSMALAKERLVQQGKNNAHCHDPLGNLLILSESRLPMSSALIPLAYAIAAGNCPILIFSPDLPTFSRTLHNILQTSGMDREAIGLLLPESSSEREQMLSEFSDSLIHGIFAQGTAETKLITNQHFLRSNPYIRITLTDTDVNPAIVSRNANVEEAAKEIVQANYGYGAAPPTAPSFIFVDEVVSQDFVTRLRNTILDTQARRRIRKLKSASDFEPSSSSVDNFKRDGGRIIELGDSKAMWIGNPDWRSLKPYESILAMKRSKPESDGILCLVPTTSLEGSISLSAQLCPDGNPTPSLFIFANQSEARYLSLSVPSAATYINHVPLFAIFTPPHLPVESTLKNIFSKPHPVIADPSSQTISISPHIFKQPTDALISSLTSTLAVQKLDPPRQKPGKQTGFFAQGGLVGLSHLLLGLAITGYAMMYLKTRALDKLS